MTTTQPLATENAPFLVRGTSTWYDLRPVTPEQAEDKGCPGANARLVGRYGETYGILTVGRRYSRRAVAEFASWPTGDREVDFTLTGTVYLANLTQAAS